MTPRDRPPTPRASGAASMSRTPSPNRTRRSATREHATAPPGRDEQTHGEVTTPSIQEVILHPTSRKPERVIGEHMKQEKSQVIQHIQEFGIGPVW